MKTRFSTYDILVVIKELQSFIGMRVNQVYDIDNKTYLLKLHNGEDKKTLLIESGSRIHSTEFDWPKNPAPSGFTMKLRKHLKNKRLTSLTQLGVDRIVDLQFGSGEATYHIIVEMYDRGNVALADHQYVILNILRPRTQDEHTRFVVRECYPIDNAKISPGMESIEHLYNLLTSNKKGDNIRKLLNPHVEFGPAIIDHVLLEAGFPFNCRLEIDVCVGKDVEKVWEALQNGEKLFKLVASSTEAKGLIIQKGEKRLLLDGSQENFYTFQEFHPMLFKQHENQNFITFDSFNMAVDEFFCKIESQKLDLKSVNQEKEVVMKLDRIRKDHFKRLEELQDVQEIDRRKAEIIENNQELVSRALHCLHTAISCQMAWDNIEEELSFQRKKGDPIAKAIHSLQFHKSHFTMILKDPYYESHDIEEENVPILIELNLELSAMGNARTYYDKKRHAALKASKTVDSQSKAIKSAEKKTRNTLKEVKVLASITKARKVFWFEKFYWFISSENFLVIAGRDHQQNEIIIRRYMKPNDLYVHADISGASSILIKNLSSEPVPPKTINEAGQIAICYSCVWEAKVVTDAWWVFPHQVSKTAPTGEYLTSGAFIIRGKKNYISPGQLVMGFGFMFRLDDSSEWRHKDERKVRMLLQDSSTLETILTSYNEDYQMKGSASDLTTCHELSVISEGNESYDSAMSIASKTAALENDQGSTSNLKICNELSAVSEGEEYDTATSMPASPSGSDKEKGWPSDLKVCNELSEISEGDEYDTATSMAASPAGLDKDLDSSRAFRLCFDSPEISQKDDIVTTIAASTSPVDMNQGSTSGLKVRSYLSEISEEDEWDITIAALQLTSAWDMSSGSASDLQVCTEISDVVASTSSVDKDQGSTSGLKTNELAEIFEEDEYTSTTPDEESVSLDEEETYPDNENKTSDIEMDEFSSQYDACGETDDMVDVDLDDDKEIVSEFPDTEINLEHITGERFAIQTRLPSTFSSDQTNDSTMNRDVVYLGDDTPVTLPEESLVIFGPTPKRKLKKISKDKRKRAVEVAPKCASSSTDSQSLKSVRGKHGKKKKILSKYKNQDDDERKKRMFLIHESTSVKKIKEKKGKKMKEQSLKKENISQKMEEEVKMQNVPKKKEISKDDDKSNVERSTAVDLDLEKVNIDSNDEEEEEKGLPGVDEVAILNGLTGLPHTDDELLFAVPVVGPYSAMANYKFKVKLTPGTTKRGKAAKTAIAAFLHDKACTPREKDLIRGVKDQDLARNIPGKVKVSIGKK